MKRLHILSALIPMAIFSVMFGLMAIFPFNLQGDRQFLVVDAWHQYYPFLSEFWHKLRGGESFLWSWTAGGGHDYVAHIGYYLASPFNFLAALFPHAWLREIAAIFIVIRVGLAGLAMSFYLRYIGVGHESGKKLDLMLPVFASFYALCAWVISFYWNFMWLDSFAMLPLVALGVHRLVKEGKYGLYIISLALSIIFNFYIGFFICIFVALLFFIICVKYSADYEINLRVFLQRFASIAICTIIALGLTLFLTIPIFAALEHTGRGEILFPGFAPNHSFIDLISNFITLMPTARAPHGGFPNIYSGMLTAMLFPVFLAAKIPLREKIAYTAAVAFILISTNIPNLNYIWHGFSLTHGLPYRYTFLISFLMIAMGFRAYTAMTTHGVQIKDIAAMTGGAAAFAILAFIGQHNNQHILIIAIFAITYIIIFIISKLLYTKKVMPMTDTSYKPLAKPLKIILLVLIVGELSLASYVGLVQGGDTTGRDNFPWAYENVQQVLDERTPMDSGFYRTDFTFRWSHNDPSLYHFQGVSIFSSLVNQNTLGFMNGLGLVNWSAANSYSFAETSPLTAAFLNINYLIDRSGNPADDGVFWERAAQSEQVLLMRNNRPLSLGFMTNFDMVDYQGDIYNPFNSQNDLFRRATGLGGDLFTLLPLSRGYGEVGFTMPFSGEIYAYVNISGINQLDIFRRSPDGWEDFPRTISVDYRAPHLFRVGTFSEGESLFLRNAAISADGIAYVGILNRELFEHGYARLAAEMWNLSYFSATRVVGDINVLRDGILFTSIPYNGNWRVRVNGENADIIAIDGAMSAVQLPAGEHMVEFYYRNMAFIVGAIVSAISLAIFVTLWLLRKRLKI